MAMKTKKKPSAKKSTSKKSGRKGQRKTQPQKAEPLKCDCGRPLVKFQGKQVCFHCRNEAIRKEARAAIMSEAAALTAASRPPVKTPRTTPGGTTGDATGTNRTRASRTPRWTFQKLVLRYDAGEADPTDPMAFPPTEGDAIDAILQHISAGFEPAADGSARQVKAADLRELGNALAARLGRSWEEIADRPLDWVATMLPSLLDGSLAAAGSRSAG